MSSAGIGYSALERAFDKTGWHIREVLKDEFARRTVAVIELDHIIIEKARHVSGVADLVIPKRIEPIVRQLLVPRMFGPYRWRAHR